MGMSIKINESELAEFSLGVVCHEENGIYVAYIPALDLTTHGESLEDAAKAAREAGKTFIEELIRMGTADQVLSELGWGKLENTLLPFPYTPPEIAVYYSQKVKVACHA